MFRNSFREETHLNKWIHFQTLGTVRNLGQNMVGILMWINRLKFCYKFDIDKLKIKKARLELKVCYYF